MSAPSTKKIFKWGILGTGLIAQDFAIALQFVPHAKLVAVGSRNAQSATEFGTKFNVPKRYSSYEELCDDPEVEIIYISTVHPLHKENALLAIHCGKSVLVEKPIAVNARELEEIIAAAKERNVFVMEAMWTRFFPIVQRVRALLKDGELGDVVGVQGDFGFVNDGRDRLMDPKLGGGAMLDIGIYPISFASMVFGGVNPSAIFASGKIGKTGVDEQAAITLCYGDGKYAQILTTIVAETNKELSIFGTKGKIKIETPFWCPTSMKVYIGTEEQSIRIGIPSVTPALPYTPNTNFINSLGLQYEISHVQKMLELGRIESDIMPLSESLIIAKTMDEVRRQIGMKYPWE